MFCRICSDISSILTTCPKWKAEGRIAVLSPLAAANGFVRSWAPSNAWVPYGLRGGNASWFMCWLQRYINCLFVCLLNLLPRLLSALLSSFIMLSFLLIYFRISLIRFVQPGPPRAPGVHRALACPTAHVSKPRRWPDSQSDVDTFAIIGIWPIMCHRDLLGA